MRKPLLSLLITSAIYILTAPASLYAQEFAGGNGSSGFPWIITTAEHLDNIRNYTGTEHADKHFILSANIDLGVSPWNDDEGWVPIGKNSGIFGINDEFYGNFDGGVFSITGLKINRPGVDEQGLFGRTINAVITGVSLINADITAGNSSGILVGHAQATEITDCSVNGSITAENMAGGVIGSITIETAVSGVTADVTVTAVSDAGGIAGYLSGNSIISGSSFLGEIFSAGNNAGGIAGRLIQSVISSSQASGKVTGMDHVGGLLGWSEAGNAVSGNSASVDVEGASFVGGLVGRHELVGGSIADNNATGSVYGTGDYVGGLAGSGRDMIRCYATGDVTGDGSYVGGLAGRIVTRAELCFASGDVTGTGDYAGGLAGIIEGVVTDCYSTGNVFSSGDFAGGFTGYTTTNQIRKSYSTGRVTAAGENVGGLATGVEFYDPSFWNAETSAHSTSSFGMPLTTAEMMQQASFYQWDFNDIWGINEDETYPWLLFQEEPGIHNYPPLHVPPSMVDGVPEIGYITITWNESSIGSPLGYNIYRDGTKVNTALLSTAQFIDSEVDNYTIYTYHVTAIYDDGGSGQETLPSSIANLYAYSGFNSGSGTPDDPYRVGNSEQLFNVRYKPQAHFIQIADITWTASPLDNDPVWTPAGNSVINFTGNYNGMGYDIEGLLIGNADDDFTGLFGYAQSAVFKGIRLTNVTVTGKSYTGAIAGSAFSSEISDCSVEGSVSGSDYVGGIAGRIYSATIENSHVDAAITGTGDYTGGITGSMEISLISGSGAAGEVQGRDFVGGIAGNSAGVSGNITVIDNSHSGSAVTGRNNTGGIAGLASLTEISVCSSTGDVEGQGNLTGGIAGSVTWNSRISSSFSTGNVLSAGDRAGGITGEADLFSSIDNSYARGDVGGLDYVGGLAGYITGSSSAENSYSTGEVTGNIVGGLVGMLTGATVSGSYFNAETAGTDSPFGGHSRTTIEMTFPYDDNTYTGWDFASTWGKDVYSELNDGYPFLQWQAADLVKSVTASAGENGNISPLYTDALFGSEILITVTPETNYYIADLLLDDVSIYNELVIDAGGNGTYRLTVAEDHVLLALFDQASYMISASAGENGSIDPEGEIQVYHGSSVAFTITANPSYHIATLTVDGSPVPQVEGESEYIHTYTNISGPGSVNATFAINTYNLNYLAGANGYLTGITSQIAEHGTDGTPVGANPLSGYMFSEWSDGVKDNPRTDRNVTGDIEVTAIFKEIMYSVTALPTENGRIEPAGTIEYSPGTSVEYIIIADEGYHILSILIDGNSLNLSDYLTSYNHYFEHINADHTVEANFRANTYIIQAEADPPYSGWISGDGSYLHGEEVTLTAHPELGYRFSNWTENGVIITADQEPVGYEYTFTASGDRFLTANFGIADYQVEFTVKDNDNLPLQNAAILIKEGDATVVTLFTDEAGKAGHYLYPGHYTCIVQAGGFIDEEYYFSVDDEDLVFEISLRLLGVDDPDTFSTGISVYPNPGNGLFTIEYLPDPVSPVIISVMSVTGNIIYINELQRAGVIKETIDLRHIPKGIYFLQVRQGAATKTVKMLFR